MTTLADRCDGWWPKMCLAGRTHTRALAASQIYNGVTRPDLWIAVAAHVADEQIFDGDGVLIVDRTDDAKQLLLDVLKDAASLLDAGELKTHILALELSDDSETMNANRLWARQRMKAGLCECQLEQAYAATIAWLTGPDKPNQPKKIQIPFEHIVYYRVTKEGLDVATVRLNVYTFMRTRMDELTFKGSYT